MAAAPAFGYGPNLVTNPGFDSGVSGWQNVTQSDWRPTDSDASPASGSVLLTWTPLGGTYGPYQCVPAAANTKYVANGSFYGPSSIPSAARPRVAVHYSTSPTCADSVGGGVSEGSALRNAWQDLSLLTISPASTVAAQVWYGWYSPNGPLIVGPQVDAAYFGTGACAPDATALCLNNGRFGVILDFNAQGQPPAHAKTVRLNNDSGGFYYFDPNNTELLVKVLNGCGINGHYWVFAAGLTNLHTTLLVKDTKTGASMTYTNPQNTLFKAVADTAAFGTCP
jgi:hypothetical protein